MSKKKQLFETIEQQLLDKIEQNTRTTKNILVFYLVCSIIVAVFAGLFGGCGAML